MDNPQAAIEKILADDDKQIGMEVANGQRNPSK